MRVCAVSCGCCRSLWGTVGQREKGPAVRPLNGSIASRRRPTRTAEDEGNIAAAARTYSHTAPDARTTTNSHIRNTAHWHAESAHPSPACPARALPHSAAPRSLGSFRRRSRHAMSLVWWLLVAVTRTAGYLVLLLLAFYLLFRLRKFQRGYRRGATSLPGPPAVPFLGNTIAFYRHRFATLPLFAQWVRRYGNTYRFTVLGDRDIVLINDPESIKHVLRLVCYAAGTGDCCPSAPHAKRDARWRAVCGSDNARRLAQRERGLQTHTCHCCLHTIAPRARQHQVSFGRVRQGRVPAGAVPRPHRDGHIQLQPAAVEGAEKVRGHALHGRRAQAAWSEEGTDWQRGARGGGRLRVHWDGWLRGRAKRCSDAQAHLPPSRRLPRPAAHPPR